MSTPGSSSRSSQHHCTTNKPLCQVDSLRYFSVLCLQPDTVVALVITSRRSSFPGHTWHANLSIDGETSCLILGDVVKLKADNAEDAKQIVRLLPATGGKASGDVREDAREVGSRIIGLVTTLGLRQSLTERRLDKDQVPIIVGRATDGITEGPMHHAVKHLVEGLYQRQDANTVPGIVPRYITVSARALKPVHCIYVDAALSGSLLCLCCYTTHRNCRVCPNTMSCSARCTPLTEKARSKQNVKILDVYRTLAFFALSAAVFRNKSNEARPRDQADQKEEGANRTPARLQRKD